MDKIDNITSILEAVNEINLKSKKKTPSIVVKQNFIPKLNQDLTIPLDVDKIISEAEKYKKKLSSNVPQADSNQNKNKIIKIKNNNKTFEETRVQIIDDLYSKFTKKIKKNTLKIIFDLHLKIQDLEKQLENYQIKKDQSLNKDKLISKDEVVVLSKTEEPLIIIANKKSNNKNILKNEVITSLKIQDSTIAVLNKKIKIFKTTEEELRFQIIDLEQDKTILLKNAKKFEEQNDYKEIVDSTKETLISIYKQVSKQKEIFLNLKSYSFKIERDFNFYKENYEKLIIENNDFKNKTIIAQEKIISYENNKLDLLSSIKQLNEVLSKSNVINDISSNKLSSKNKVVKK